MHKLTIKQQRFVDFYDGNATDAARKAGYRGNINTLKQVGAENLAKLYMAEAIAKREKKHNKKHIANREERQEFWTDLMKTAEKDSDKLKASELLGRSNADFIDKQEIKTDITIEDVSNVLKKRIQDNIK
jgi:phage terminase small subunit